MSGNHLFYLIFSYKITRKTESSHFCLYAGPNPLQSHETCVAKCIQFCISYIVAQEEAEYLGGTL
jgi:hypothetical protein